MTKRSAQARSRLDARFQRIGALTEDPRPHRGWIRAIRDALGMSSTELASRMRVSQQTVADLERSELRGTIQLNTLQRAANALECDLVYTFRPRRSLDETVRTQARWKAAQHLNRVAHHSRLEDQTVADAAAAVELDELTTRFIDRRGLWSEQAPS